MKPSEGRWIAKPAKPTHASTLFIVLSIGLTIWRWLNHLPNPGGSAAAAIQLGYDLLMIFAVSIFAYMVWAWRTFFKKNIVLENSFGDQFAVNVTFTAGNRSIGADCGTLWFADGLMGFSGSAASFVLCAGDLVDAYRDVSRRHPPLSLLVLRGAPVPRAVSIVHLGKDRKEFIARLARFISDDEPGQGARFWPPLKPHREIERA